MHRNRTGVVLGLAAAAMLAACSPGGAGTGNAAAGTASAAAVAGASGSADADAQTVEVTAKDFSLSLPTNHFAPGTYTFRMANDGHATHAIELAGPGVSDAQSGTAGPGGSASFTVTLQKGTYELFCPVGNHRALGMQTNFTVG